MNVVIRKAEARDLAEFEKIEKECFSIPWSLDSFKSAFSSRLSKFLAAECGGEIAGYITANNVLGEIEIYNIAVEKKFRRKGIASLLLSELEKEGYESISLEVRKSNFAALELYKKCGFERVGTRKDFYKQPKEDAVLMTKTKEG